MNQLVKKILGSLDNGDNGASGKKMTALFVTIFCLIVPVLTWTYWAYNHNNWDLLTGLIVIVTGFIATLFGLNVVDKYKNAKASESENNTTE